MSPRPVRPTPSPAVDVTLDRRRLAQLRDALGSEPAEIAHALRDEIARAVSGIDAGLRAGDLAAVALATHAARNSALLIDAQPVSDQLQELECCARREELEPALAARERLGLSWEQLRERLSQIAEDTRG